MKRCYYQTLSNPKDFQYWLTEKFGPVILGAKPAELLCFSENDEKSKQRIDMIEESIDRISSLDYRQIKGSGGRIKILFYHPELLVETLKDKKNHRFLIEQGYTQEVDLNIYLDELIHRIATGCIPHEIGIFLGYPLKDVLGYMGHSSLKLTKIKGWKVYGDPTISDRIYESIEKAKGNIRKQLESQEPEKVMLQLSLNAKPVFN